MTYEDPIPYEPARASVFAHDDAMARHPAGGENAVLDLINYSEWLDCQHLMCSLVDDERTHEELARDYLAQR